MRQKTHVKAKGTRTRPDNSSIPEHYNIFTAKLLTHFGTAHMSTKTLKEIVFWLIQFN